MTTKFMLSDRRIQLNPELKASEHEFRALFGISEDVCGHIWDHISRYGWKPPIPAHLAWLGLQELFCPWVHPSTQSVHLSTVHACGARPTLPFYPQLKVAVLLQLTERTSLGAVSSSSNSCHHPSPFIKKLQAGIPCRAAGIRPKHLLWTLLFLKVYGTEILSALAKTSRKMFRKWYWLVLPLIAEMDTYVVCKQEQ
jgi:hypothetical protein